MQARSEPLAGLAVRDPAEASALLSQDSIRGERHEGRSSNGIPELHRGPAVAEEGFQRPRLAELQLLSDIDLIALAKQHDDRAFGALCARYRDILIGSIRYRLPDGLRDGRTERPYSAEDAAREAEEIAWRKLDKYDASIAPFGPWLKGIARWVVFRHFGPTELGDDRPRASHTAHSGVEGYPAPTGLAKQAVGSKARKGRRGSQDYYRCEVAWSELRGRGKGGPSLHAGDDAIDAAQRRAETWLSGDDADDADDCLDEIPEPPMDGGLDSRNEQRAIEARLRELADRKAAEARAQYVEEDFRRLFTGKAASRRPVFQILPWMMRRMFDLQPSHIAALACSPLEQLLVEAAGLVHRHSSLQLAAIEEMLRPCHLELARPVAQVVRDKRTRVRLLARWVARGSIVHAEEFFASPVGACRLCDFFAHSNPAAAEIPHWIQSVDRSCGRSLPSLRRRSVASENDRTFTSFNPQHAALWAA